MNPAIETALDALRNAIESYGIECANKALADYKASEAPVATPVEPSEPVKGGEAEAPATASYSQQEYDDGIAAQKQSDQANLEAVTAKYDAVQAQNQALKADIAELKEDFAKLEKDAE